MNHKCSVVKCRKDISSEDESVFVVRLIPPREGHRLVCEEHYQEVRTKKVKPTRFWIFGVLPRSRKKSFRRR